MSRGPFPPNLDGSEYGPASKAELHRSCPDRSLLAGRFQPYQSLSDPNTVVRARCKMHYCWETSELELQRGPQLSWAACQLGKAAPNHREPLWSSGQW